MWVLPGSLYFCLRLCGLWSLCYYYSVLWGCWVSGTVVMAPPAVKWTHPGFFWFFEITEIPTWGPTGKAATVLSCWSSHVLVFFCVRIIWPWTLLVYKQDMGASLQLPFLGIKLGTYKSKLKGDGRMDSGSYGSTGCILCLPVQSSFFLSPPPHRPLVYSGLLK